MRHQCDLNFCDTDQFVPPQSPSAFKLVSTHQNRPFHILQLRKPAQDAERLLSVTASPATVAEPSFLSEVPEPLHSLSGPLQQLAALQSTTLESYRTEPISFPPRKQVQEEGSQTILTSALQFDQAGKAAIEPAVFRPPSGPRAEVRVSSIETQTDEPRVPLQQQMDEYLASHQRQQGTLPEIAQPESDANSREPESDPMELVSHFFDKASASHLGLDHAVSVALAHFDQAASREPRQRMMKEATHNHGANIALAPAVPHNYSLPIDLAVDAPGSSAYLSIGDTEEYVDMNLRSERAYRLARLNHDTSIVWSHRNTGWTTCFQAMPMPPLSLHLMMRSSTAVFQFSIFICQCNQRCIIALWRGHAERVSSAAG